MHFYNSWARKGTIPPWKDKIRKAGIWDAAYTHYFLALQQAGVASKILVIAEKVVANFPENEDLLLVLADTGTPVRFGTRRLLRISP